MVKAAGFTLKPFHWVHLGISSELELSGVFLKKIMQSRVQDLWEEEEKREEQA